MYRLLPDSVRADDTNSVARHRGEVDRPTSDRRARRGVQGVHLAGGVGHVQAVRCPVEDGSAGDAEDAVGLVETVGPHLRPETPEPQDLSGGAEGEEDTVLRADVHHVGRCAVDVDAGGDDG